MVILDTKLEPFANDNCNFNATLHTGQKRVYNSQASFRLPMMNLQRLSTVSFLTSHVGRFPTSFWSFSKLFEGQENFFQVFADIRRRFWFKSPIIKEFKKIWVRCCPTTDLGLTNTWVVVHLEIKVQAMEIHRLKYLCSTRALHVPYKTLHTFQSWSYLT